MKTIDPDVIRRLVRQTLEEKLGLNRPSLSEPNPTKPLNEHPSHLDVISDCASEDELPTSQPCLIEPHRMCSGSGYCKKLGF